MRQSNVSGVAVIVGATIIGAAAGGLIGGGVWAIVGGVIGLGTAALILVVGVRPVVAIPVAIGAGVGAFVGGSIVGVLCEPEGCVAFEAGAAIITGIGALVGIGLVVALATRSFDEYSDSVERGQSPPSAGSSPDDS